MELSEFVSKTLGEILKGVSDAQKNANYNGIKIAPSLKHYFDSTHHAFVDKSVNLPGDYAISDDGQVVVMVDFDVMLAKSEGGESKSGIGVFLGSAGIGTQAKADESQKTETKVHFRVPVVLPHSS